MNLFKLGKNIVANSVNKPQTTKDRVSALLSSLVGLDLYPEMDTFNGSTTEPTVELKGKKINMFGSNNYLSLANLPIVKERAIKTIEKHGLGPGGSRNLIGSIDFIVDFEKYLADYVGVEDVLTFPTGYMANLSVFQAIMGPSLAINPLLKDSGGIIFSDRFNHATIVDGCRLSSAKKYVYRHNDLDELEQQLKSTKHKNKFIVTESVFSTEGELINIPDYVLLAKKYRAYLMVDDAHGIGVLGDGGGVIKHFNMTNEKPDVLMASFDKAVGTMGAFIGGSKELIKYLRVAARPYMFSSTLPMALVAGSWASLEHLSENQNLIKKTHQNAYYLRKKLRDLGLTVLGNDKTPVVPLLVGEDQLGIVFQKELLENGFYAPCFRFPAVDYGKSRLRISMMADHTEQQIDNLANAIESIAKKYKLI